MTISVEVDKIQFSSTSVSSATRVVLGPDVKKRSRKGQGPQEKSLKPDMKGTPTRALTHQSYVIFLIVSHMTVSSTMLILNKAVLKRLPVATTVLLAQVGSSAVILWILGKLKVLTVDPFQLSTVSLMRPIFSLPEIVTKSLQARAFFWNAVAFMVLLFTNAKALESANVETVIVFRTLSIFATAYGDFRY